MQSAYIKQSKFYLAVDCVIFGYEEQDLKVLLYPRGFKPEQGKWSLPGGFIRKNEAFEDAARRILFDTTGLKSIYLDQVKAFSEINRDPEDRVISMAHYALVQISKQDDDQIREHGAHWWPIKRLPRLIFDHKDMINIALNKLQYLASTVLIGEELILGNFTINQLRNLYSAIFQRHFDPSNFRKKILSLDVLKRLDIKDKSESKKGAYLYTFKSDNSEFRFYPSLTETILNPKMKHNQPILMQP